jgi:hypothetical protein
VISVETDTGGAEALLVDIWTSWQANHFPAGALAIEIGFIHASTTYDYSRSKNGSLSSPWAFDLCRPLAWWSAGMRMLDIIFVEP